MSVYFMQIPGGGPIKIGTTTGTAKSRQNEIQTGCPWELNVVGVIAGGVETEHKFHRVFAHYRIRGEWFAPGPEIIALLKRSGFTPEEPYDWTIFYRRCPDPSDMSNLVNSERASFYYNPLWICWRAKPPTVFEMEHKELIRSIVRQQRPDSVLINSGAVTRNMVELVISPSIGTNVLNFISHCKSLTSKQLQIKFGFNQSDVWLPGYACIGIGMDVAIDKFAPVLLTEALRRGPVDPIAIEPD
ncbi:MAG: GIY-YIG nuclease family protein [bacterium]